MIYNFSMPYLVYEEFTEKSFRWFLLEKFCLVQSNLFSHCVHKMPAQFGNGEKQDGRGGSRRSHCASVSMSLLLVEV